MTQTVNIAVVIPAAGVGKRMGANRPKQYIALAGRTILQHTVARMADIPGISRMMVAVSPNDEYFPSLDFSPSDITRVDGGKERADSVLNALKMLDEKEIQWVLVHDAARPLVQIADIENLIANCLAENEGGILAARVKDTIKRGDQYVENTVPREQLWQALTPQFFPLVLLRDALENALQQGVPVTDEASAMEWAGHPVRLVEGRSDNIKITNPEDLSLAAFLLARQQESV